MWILIRWLHQKPADLDLHCFQKRINTGSAREWLQFLYLSDIKQSHICMCIYLVDFPRPDFGPNIGPFPIQKRAKLSKMVYIIPNF